MRHHLGLLITIISCVNVLFMLRLYSRETVSKSFTGSSEGSSKGRILHLADFLETLNERTTFLKCILHILTSNPTHPVEAAHHFHAWEKFFNLEKESKVDFSIRKIRENFSNKKLCLWETTYDMKNFTKVSFSWLENILFDCIWPSVHSRVLSSQRLLPRLEAEGKGESWIE